MKTILYNPIFINPLAYYVFPRLTRYLQPDNESTAEPANYIGTIEVKVIAYGDTTLKRTYTNTDSIDLSEFKNTWIRISLFTKVGSCVLGEWKIGNMESDLPYIDPEVLASLKAVVIVGNKTNNDSDRAIVKNLVDPDNPFVISNAAYDKMSSYGGYEFAKFDNTLDWYNTEGNDSVEVVSRNGHSITLKRLTGPNFWYFQNSTFRGLISNVIPFKVNSNKNITVIWDVHGLSISEGKDKSVRIQELVLNPNEDNYTNLKTLNEEELAQIDISTNSLYYLLWFDLSTLAVDEEVTIEMLPLFEGAFVTDGIDDLITSTKTVQEMLGGSNEFTVVSMMANLDSVQMMCNSNYNNTNGYNPRNTLEPNGVISMLGYTDKNGTTNNLNLIMGDKDSIKLVDKVNFNSDYVFYPAQYYGSYYKAAWYWTVIANKVLTTDQINQVIAYFNLDRTLNPDILCNVKKQGITNDNHAEFGDKLIDFSGNGRDIQLNNIAWKGNSGIGKYEVDFLDWVINSPFINERTSFTFSSSNDTNNDIITIYQRVPAATQSFKIKAKLRGRVLYRYYVNNGDTISISYYEVKEGINILPDSADPTSVNGKVGFVLKGLSSVKVEQVPFHAGGLCLDGINDSGKVTGMPIYKDYTFIIDYERISYTSSEVWTASVVSKAHTVGQGAFILMLANREVELSRQSNSFGSTTTFNRDDFTRTLLYQSKYKCGDVNLTVGEGIDGDTLWLGTLRDNDYRFFNGAIYSLMSFPYSMSEFLIERQLKKHKLGTPYPNMVEFRPVIKANGNYKIFYTALLPLTGIVWEKINIGDYIPVGRRVAIQLSFDNEASELVSAISSQLGNISITKNSNNKGYTIFGDILKNKSPQKINITIDEYIRYEDIVQPYPVLLRFNDENGNEVSWGGKFRVGSTITRIGSAADSNLLPNIYNIFGLLLNGNKVTSSKAIVEKTMVFKAASAYIFDNNEPKCILSPRLLRIPNSSYKILGHIPDISGHGNNGVIHNSAYAEGSGVNEDGSYQFDGVDDFVTIPTVTGGKQVLMKVNWQKSPALLYDQRASGSFAVLTTLEDDAVNPRIAYQARNQNGKTYIDGIENNNIETYTLKDITHNITIANSSLGGIIVPVIGCNTGKSSNFAKMSLYDFMLFDNISTDDKIKELNEYVGIEGNTEWRKTK